MKKPFVLIAAIVAVVGFGAVAAVAKETIKVKTSVTLKYDPNDPSDPYGGGGWFSGRVKAKEGCQGGRQVVLYDQGLGLRHGSDTSNARGNYKIKFTPGSAGPSFHARAKEKIIKDNGNTIVCKPAASNTAGFGPHGS